MKHNCGDCYDEVLRLKAHIEYQNASHEQALAEAKQSQSDTCKMCNEEHADIVTEAHKNGLRDGSAHEEAMLTAIANSFIDTVPLGYSFPPFVRTIAAHIQSIGAEAYQRGRDEQREIDAEICEDRISRTKHQQWVWCCESNAADIRATKGTT